jgi:hypothetical protein
MPRTLTQQPITYRDCQSRVWYVSEVARLKVVSPAIDGPNLCLVIRLEREGDERFARWIGGELRCLTGHLSAQDDLRDRRLRAGASGPLPRSRASATQSRGREKFARLVPESRFGFRTRPNRSRQETPGGRVPVADVGQVLVRTRAS